MKKIIYFLLLLLSLAANVLLFYKYNALLSKTKEAQLITPEKYPLVNPIIGTKIDVNVQSPTLILHYKDLNAKLTEEINKTGKNIQVGVFVQDVKTGAWMGINEQQGFVPASLLKVPLMMATLKKVERGEIKLTDSTTLIAEDLNNESGDLYTRGVGTTLTIWELLKQMILTSDNTAKNAIKRQLLPAEINAVFAHIGIENPYQTTTSQEVTPRGYTRVFKSLYLSSYLTPELSQKALDLTTDTQVESLISAGVPPEIQVAHKYGERPDGLSDCGIVYHPQNPYYICIMTKEVKADKVKDLISNLSRIVYNYVDNREKVESTDQQTQQ